MSYTLHDTTLRTTENAKYLGVPISSNLNWSSHINTITNKAKNSLRFIRWNAKTQNKQLKEAAYRTHVRPQVAYCSTIWHPWQKHLTHRIEMVKRSAARYVQNDFHYTSSVTNMLRELKWSTLEQRRNQASLTMLHKIHNKQVNVDHSHLTTTRNNKFLISHSKKKHHMNSFFLRAIRLWNELPTEIKDAPTVPAFASELNKFFAFNWYFSLVILCWMRATSCHYDFVPGDFVPLYWRLRATYIFIEENINDSFWMYLNVFPFN